MSLLTELGILGADFYKYYAPNGAKISGPSPSQQSHLIIHRLPVSLL